jgi:hypothetical protein
MMTKRNFEDVARAMRDLKPEKQRDEDGILLADHILWTKTVHRLANVFASRPDSIDNPEFKWDVFLTACEEPKALAKAAFAGTQDD